MKSKKGQGMLGNLGGLAVAVVTLTIVLVVGFLILAEGKTQIGTIEGITVTNSTQCDASSACAATNTMVSALADIPSWLGIIVITVIGALLLGLIKMFN